MAKSNSFNKREIEKSKQQKRKEKRQKKEERKNNPTNSFDDMIAYVDENQPLTGRVEFFDEKKGFGFIKDQASVNKYFFHISNSEPDIKENNQVTFKLERNSKGLSAIEVKIIK